MEISLFVGSVELWKFQTSRMLNCADTCWDEQKLKKIICDFQTFLMLKLLWNGLKLTFDLGSFVETYDRLKDVNFGFSFILIRICSRSSNCSSVNSPANAQLSDQPYWNIFALVKTRMQFFHNCAFFDDISVEQFYSLTWRLQNCGVLVVSFHYYSPC